MMGVVSRRIVLALAAVACIAWAGTATAAPVKFKVQLTAAAETPPSGTKGKGVATLTWNASTRVLTWHVTYHGTSSDVTMAHFHNGAVGQSGPVVIWITKKGSPVKSPINGKTTLTPEQAQQLEAGGWYINVHTTDHPGGEIRGQVIVPKS